MERMDTANGRDAVPAAESDRRPAREQDPSDADTPRAELAHQASSPKNDDVPGTVEPGGIGADGGDDGAQLRKVRRVPVLLAVAAVAYALDIITKALVAANMHYDQPIRLLGPVLQLYYTRNSGAAFSIGTTYTFIFTAIAVGVIVVILRLARSLFSLSWAIALGLLLGGALGNLTDRIVRAPGLFRGWVVDFIQVPHWPIFNLADSSICVGGALMVLLAFRGLHPDGTDERAAQARSGAGAKPSDAGSNGSDGAAS